MIKVAICDDENRIREHLKCLTEQYIQAECTLFQSGEELLTSEESFDVILLDICMQSSDLESMLNGMDTARRLHNTTNALIIFITALREYVFDAYDVDAFQYLQKPVNPEKLKEVLEKAKVFIERKRGREPFTVQTESGVRSIPAEQIQYIENEARKLFLHTCTECISCCEKIGILENHFGGDFFRSHRRYLVNLEAVKSYDKTTITLKSGDIISLAKKKYNDFVVAYMNHLMNH